MRIKSFRPWPGMRLLAILLTLGGCGSGGEENAAATGPLVTVYKSPSCSCCGKWVEHLQDNGFRVQVEEQDNLMPVKQKLGVPAGLGSCHTAEVNGYVIEGHVPAQDIRRLLKERPEVRGLAVPGMPIGSPGMEMGERRDPYDVYLFGAQEAKPAIFSSHHQSAETPKGRDQR